MIINRKRLMLGVGAASLLTAGMAMASPPSGFSFGQYSVSAGTITATDTACGTTYTCVVLPGSNASDGFLQRQITNNSTGQSYIQTVVVDNLTNGPADTGGQNAIVSNTAAATPTLQNAVYNLGWTDENYVAITNNGTGANEGMSDNSSVTLTDSSVVIPNTTDARGGNNQLVSTIAAGNLLTAADPADVVIQQRMKVDPGGATGVNGQGQTDFYLLNKDSGPGGGSEDNRFMELNQLVTSNVVEGFTVRKASGSFTATGGTLALPDGQTLAYNAGDDIGVTWLQTTAMGGAGDPATDTNKLQVQNYTVNGTTIAWNSCRNDSTNLGMGQCNPVNTTARVGDPTTWPYWDANLGPTPSPLNGDTGANPPGGFFPTFPGEGGTPITGP